MATSLIAFPRERIVRRRKPPEIPQQIIDAINVYPRRAREWIQEIEVWQELADLSTGTFDAQARSRPRIWLSDPDALLVNAFMRYLVPQGLPEAQGYELIDASIQCMFKDPIFAEDVISMRWTRVRVQRYRNRWQLVMIFEVGKSTARGVRHVATGDIHGIFARRRYSSPGA